MILNLIFFTNLVFIIGAESPPPYKNSPNIIIFLADDMGWDDVGFHGNDFIKTPNIDALAYYGITLNRFYSLPLCTPSRTALMTGKYPIHTGTQQSVIINGHPWGLGLDEKILPQHLKELGYSTHLVGKWHLGMFKKEYFPTNRGYDSFFGYLTGFIDYYNYSASALRNPEWKPGYDLRENLNVYRTNHKTYLTDLITTRAKNVIEKHNKGKPLYLLVSHAAPHAGDKIPLQAPPEEIEKFSYIEDERTRTYAAMIHRMDQSIGEVMNELKNHNMLENSVVIFYSDNGAPPIGIYSNHGSNLPFKGQKETPWEGALRVPAAIWSPLVQQRERNSNELYHATDLLPTLVNLAGGNLDTSNLDGFDIWKSLSEQQSSPRNRIFHNLDDEQGYEVYMKNNWKYVNGSTFGGKYDYHIKRVLTETYSNPKYTDDVKKSTTGQILKNFSMQKGGILESKIKSLRTQTKINCNLKNLESIECKINSPCLYNLHDDPCEYQNVAANYTEILEEMKNDVSSIRLAVVPPRNKPSDPNADPAKNCMNWTNWYDESPPSYYSLNLLYALCSFRVSQNTTKHRFM